MSRFTTSFLFFILCITSIPVWCQSSISNNDGPYIQYFKDSIEILWVKDGQVMIDTIHNSEPYLFNHQDLPKINVQELQIKKDTVHEYQGVKNMAAVSDIHGQFDLFRRLLIAHGIVNDKDDWTFGNGHLVIVGDVFDRGPEVTRCLWYIYHLEDKAIKSGGQVHFLLGNHEVMVINNDQRYIHKKYKFISTVTQRPYSGLFGKNTFFGKWLSNKKIAISVNDILFVHGGISEKVVNLDLQLDEINRIFGDQILFEPDSTIQEDSVLNLLAGTNGPVWYRGYAYPSEFSQKRTKAILKYLDKDAIVVGHTTMQRIKGLYNNRILFIDSNIKSGKSGEILLWDASGLYRGKLDGSKQNLVSEEDKLDNQSLFMTIHHDPLPKLSLSTDIKTVHQNETETYNEGILHYAPEDLSLSYNVGVRASGNLRRKVCLFPPLKLNFKQKEIKAFGFAENDKLKIVFPCKKGSKYDNYLKKEHLIYELYNIIDSISFKSKLIEFTLDGGNKKSHEYIGLLVENKDHFSERTGCLVIEEGVIRKPLIDTTDFLMFNLFQFMIANPDFHVPSRHNLAIYKNPKKEKLSLLPYDFDSSGLINAEYVGPPQGMPINALTERYFMDKSATMKEMEPIILLFLEKKEALLDHCNTIDYMDGKTKQKIIGFLEKSFEIIENRKKAKRSFGIKDE